MDVKTPNGFIHLSDLINIHKHENIFSVPKNEEPDILEKMEEQEKKDKGVAFDLRLGKLYYLSGDDAPKKLSDGGYIKIQPGQFALLTIYEIFHMPKDLVAFISMRFTVKAKGLVNVSGFQVDPGYDGLFIFSVYNAGPTNVRIKYKQEIFTVVFSKTSKPVNNIITGHTEIPFTMWEHLTEPKRISLIGLDERLSKIESGIKLAKYLIPTGIALAGVIVTLFEVVMRPK